MGKKKKINLEIERKFLLKNLPSDIFLDKKKYDKIDIVQHYFLIDGIWQRYRVASSKGGQKFIHTIKHSLSPGVFQEDEREITFKEYVDVKEKFCKGSRSISKTRYVFKYKGLKFEIDVYKKLTLVTLEVELPKIDYVYETPKFISKEILIELTGMKHFSNFSLSEKVGK